METLPSLDRDCSALAGLFQIIVNEMKVRIQFIFLPDIVYILLRMLFF